MKITEKLDLLDEKIVQLNKLVDEINKMELMPTIKARCYIAQIFGEDEENMCVTEPHTEKTERRKENE